MKKLLKAKHSKKPAAKRTHLGKKLPKRANKRDGAMARFL